MSNPWDAAATGWDDEPAVRAYAEAATGSLRLLLDERDVGLAGAVVCDFGCGTGLLTEQLIGDAEAIDAVDTSQAMLDVLDRKIDAHGWSGIITSTELPATNGQHDLVVCSSVCGFLDDYPGTVVRLASLLRPGGVFVQWDWERTDEDDDHGLTRDEIRGALSGAGLVDLFVDTGFAVEIEGQTMSPLIGVGQRASTE